LNIERFQQVAEPVFSVTDELVLQNFRSVLRKGLDDNALLSAVMLTFSFKATESMTSSKYLEYQNEALSSIRQRMSSPDRAATEPTIGAILLLAGIEVCAKIPAILPYSEPLLGSKSKVLSSRSGLECHVKYSSTWGQYNTFLTYAKERASI
jgi:hypothetical protein